jgi:dTDP-4-dehydrorhamnose reductase
MATALVLGSSGMVGRAVAARLRELEGVEVRCPNRHAVDALDPPDLDPFLAGVDLAVNAVGLLRSHPDYPGPGYRLAATRVNALFPLLLAAAAERVGCRVVHVSTDAVFATGSAPADETTEISPGEPYGLTKALGESDSEVVVNVRCSVVGPAPGRSGLWEWFVGQPSGAEVPGFTGGLWTGVTSRQLANLCSDLLDPVAFARVRASGAQQHFVPNEPITKHKLLDLMREALRPDLAIVPDPGQTSGRIMASRTGALDAVFSGERGWRSAMAEAIAAG